MVIKLRLELELQVKAVVEMPLMRLRAALTAALLKLYPEYDLARLMYYPEECSCYFCLRLGHYTAERFDS